LMFAATVSAQPAPTAPPAPPRAPDVQVGQKDGFFTTKDGVKIHYLTHGNRGSWVVLVHGYSDSAQRMWFNTGIAPEIAKHHRVVAIDNRNHGQSDKPQPGGSGRAQDVIELMDHLKIARAHIHGYSMGGGITGQLLGLIPDRFITAGFGGSGMSETNAVYRAEAEAMDDALPKATGADAAGLARGGGPARRQPRRARATTGAPGRSHQADHSDPRGERLVRQSVPQDASAVAGSADLPERDPAGQDPPHRHRRGWGAGAAVHRRDCPVHRHV
jgi:pimeloyl-ACP methyl ester carboxylesterase